MVKVRVPTQDPSPELGEPILAEVPAEPAAVAPAMPKPGDSVTYHDLDGDHAGTVIFARGDAAAPQCDLVVYRAGVPQALASVPHGPGRPRCWSRAGEVPRNPTVADLLAEAEARGERVPKVGLEVLYLVEIGGVTHSHVIGARAKVVEVLGPHEIALDYFVDEKPPADPSIEDRIVGRIRHVGQGTKGSHSWCFPDQWAPRGPTSTLPENRCTRCASSPGTLHHLYVGNFYPGMIVIPPAAANLCSSCLEATRLFWATLPAPANA
jgi:hypothetical protein